LKKEFVHFATPFNKGKPPTKLKRLTTRVNAILKVYKNKILGHISITDRYIYLTFRKNHPALKNILRTIAPTPDLLFITHAPTKEIQKRKKGQRDLLSEGQIKELYEVYNTASAKKKIQIDTQKPISQNISTIVNSFLKKVLLPIDVKLN